MLGLGIMSGSSLDGLDIALVEIDFNSSIEWQLLQGTTYPIENNLKQKLQSATEANPFQYAEIEYEFSKFVVDSILDFRSVNGKSEDFIALHGHTVVHLPGYMKSVQMINAAFVAEHCQSITVTDFRNNDMALGGQGTPMAVLADKFLFPGNDYYLNLGGIANISFKKKSWQAYDLFPFNQVLNCFAQKLGFPFDEDGALAAKGQIDVNLLEALKTHKYVLKPAPKSLDNSEVKRDWIDFLENYNLDYRLILRTFVEFTCFHLEQLIPANSTIMITGGGTHNLHFIEQLKNKLSHKSISVHIPSQSIIEYKEAILMAFAGALRLKEEQNFIGTATGAKNDTIGGAVYLPSTYGRS